MSRSLIMFLAAFLVLAPVGLLAALSVLARRPGDLGARSGRLAGCPATPNCVSSTATDPAHAIAPLAFAGDPEAALERLVRVLEVLPRTQVISRQGGYLHAEATSRLFRFVDDLEFLLDPDRKLIHVRSASRAGRSDLGANRARVERIRESFR